MVVVVVVLVVILVLVTTVPVLVPFIVLVPTVIVFKPAAISIPVTRKKLLSVVMRPDPPSACIGRPRPVAFMPPVVVADWIPITVYPRELRAWAWRHNANHTGTRRRANSDAKRNLGLRCRCFGHQHHGKQQGCPNEIHNGVEFSFPAPMNPIVQIAPPSKLQPRAKLDT
jgi:hypothetical protein